MKITNNPLDNTKYINTHDDIMFQFEIENREIYIIAYLDSESTLFVDDELFPFNKEELTAIENEIAKQYFGVH